MVSGVDHRLAVKAARVRLDVLNMGLRARSGHLASGLSCTEILTALYYGGVLRVDPAHPDAPDRDRFVLSKGHGCMPLYVILADLGFFPRHHLDTFVSPGSILGCHADRTRTPGIEVTSGSLGMGLSMAVGMAWWARYAGRAHRVFALLGDGECQEGMVWEAAMFAGSRGLDNLTVIVDHNGFGATARLKDTADVVPLAGKLTAFNFSVREIDGHDFAQVLPALASVPFASGQPSAIVARCVKGKGIGLIERAYAAGDPKWHYRVPKTPEEAREALLDLEGALARAEVRRPGGLAAE